MLSKSSTPLIITRRMVVMLCWLCLLVACANKQDQSHRNDQDSVPYGDSNGSDSGGRADSSYPHPAPPATAVPDDPNSGEPPTTAADTTAPDGKVSERDTVKRSATLGLSFYQKMKLNEVKPLSVFVSVKNGQARLRQEIRNRTQQYNINMKANDTSAIYTYPINVYEKLTVRLVYDSSDFQVMPLSNPTQRIDTLGTTRWTWNVKAISTKERSSIITVVMDPEPRIDGTDDIDPVNFNVKITFSFWDMVRSWIIYLGDNPQWTLTTLIIPIVVYFFRKRKKARQAKQNEPASDDEEG